MITPQFQRVHFKNKVGNHQPLCIYIYYSYLSNLFNEQCGRTNIVNIYAEERHNNKIAESSGWASI